MALDSPQEHQGRDYTKGYRGSHPDFTSLRRTRMVPGGQWQHDPDRAGHSEMGHAGPVIWWRYSGRCAVSRSTHGGDVFKAETAKNSRFHRLGST